MWSISGAWSVNHEKFLRDAKWLDNLRLRASYGAQGNIDRSTSPLHSPEHGPPGTSEAASKMPFSYPRRPTRTCAGRPPTRGMQPSISRPSKTASDSRSKSTAATARTSSRHARSRRRRDSPRHRAISGEMSSKGIEFTLNTVNVRTRDFRWETSINIAHNTDRVDKVHIDENSYTPSKEGYSSSAVFAYKTAGLDEYGIPMLWKDGQKVSLREFTDFRLDKTDYGFFVLYDPQVSTSQSAIRNNLSYIGSQKPEHNRRFQQPVLLQELRPVRVVQLRLRPARETHAVLQPDPNQSRREQHDRNRTGWSPENTSGIYPALTGNLKPDGTTWSGWDEWGSESRSVLPLQLDSGTIQFDQRRQPDSTTSTSGTRRSTTSA